MEHNFQINLRGIIDLLSEHLYSGPDVYVRELLQNGVDAITARGKLGDGFEPEITLECYAPRGKPRSVVITDNGVGLTADEVHKFLATIGLSSKRAADGSRPVDFIGQFGIGILSCFVVSEEIVVLTRSARDPQAPTLEWRARSDGTYTLKELSQEFKPGTQVWLTAKAESEQHFEPDEVRRLAIHYGGLLPFPIRVTGPGVGNTIINAEPPPWRRKFATEKERHRALLEFGRQAFDTDFFDAIPLKSTVGKVDGVAFVLPYSPSVSASARRSHRIYLKNMFVSDTVDNVLPDWAFFVRAVVNANDLRPTASRESLYEDRKLEQVRETLGDALRDYLVSLAESRPEQLDRFLALHHRSLKALARDDDAFYRVVIDHLPFETSLGSMKFSEFRRENSHVRFVTSVDAFRQVSRVAAAQGLCVFNGGYVDDTELLAKVDEVFPDMTVEAIEPGDIAESFADLSEAEQSQYDAFLDAADVVLKPYRCRATVRKFVPHDLPALFSTSKDGLFFRSLEQSKEAANPLWSGVLNNLSRRERAEAGMAQLCFNAQNSLVQKLVQVADRSRLTRGVEMIYLQALLMGHHPLSARELTALNRGLLAFIEDSTRDTANDTAKGGTTE